MVNEIQRRRLADLPFLQVIIKFRLIVAVTGISVCGHKYNGRGLVVLAVKENTCNSVHF
jgi:hypothetical protein